MFLTTFAILQTNSREAAPVMGACEKWLIVLTAVTGTGALGYSSRVHGQNTG
jgi:hypothetical protein